MWSGVRPVSHGTVCQRQEASPDLRPILNEIEGVLYQGKHRTLGEPSCGQPLAGPVCGAMRPLGQPAHLKHFKVLLPLANAPDLEIGGSPTDRWVTVTKGTCTKTVYYDELIKLSCCRAKVGVTFKSSHL